MNANWWRWVIALKDAIDTMNYDANQQINWSIGDILRERGARADWRDCPILQHLETGSQRLRAWNELFRRTRAALQDENNLRTKARAMLNPQNPSFDVVLGDFIAEMLAAQYLSRLGHRDVRFTSDEDAITADLLSSHNDVAYVCEVKNLREPNNLTNAAFARWHRNQAENRERYNFTAEFVGIDDPFEDLTREQGEAVRNLVDALPERRRPSTFTVTLPGNRRLHVHVSDGAGVAVRMGPGPFLVGPIVEKVARSTVLKLLKPTRKAMAQLYSSAVPSDSRRLLFLRWKPPEEVGVIGEAENVRGPVMQALQAFIGQFFEQIAVVIVHTYEDIEQAPLAVWGQVAQD